MRAVRTGRGGSRRARGARRCSPPRGEAAERRLGGRRKSGHALPPTESRVAELAGDGLRNAEIATRLHVTPKTVEATLSRGYRKLGVRSRTELARALPRAGDP